MKEVIVRGVDVTNHVYTEDHRPLRLPPDRGELTEEELRVLVDVSAHELLGLSAEEAFARIDRGELDGTFAEGSLRSLRWLLRRVSNSPDKIMSQIARSEIED